MAEPSSAHVRLLVDLKDGKNMLEFGPATRHSMLNRGREMFDAGLKHADYYIGDELIVFGTVVPGTKGEADEESAEVEDKPTPPPTARTARPGGPAGTGDRAGDRVLTLEDAGDLCKTLIGNAVEAANQLLDGASRRSMESSDAILRQQRAADSHLVQQAEELRQMVGKMNATAAEERLALFRIKSAEEQLEERRAKDEYLKQLAIAEANKPNGVTLVVELAAAFLGRLAANTSANYTAINVAQPVEES